MAIYLSFECLTSRAQRYRRLSFRVCVAGWRARLVQERPLYVFVNGPLALRSGRSIAIPNLRAAGRWTLRALGRRVVGDCGDDKVVEKANEVMEGK